MSNLLTVSQIADSFGEPPQRVAYIIRKFRIKPERRIGIIRLFEDKQLAAIKQGLYGIRIHQDRTTSNNPTTFTGKESA